MNNTMMHGFFDELGLISKLATGGRPNLIQATMRAREAGVPDAGAVSAARQFIQMTGRAPKKANPIAAKLGIQGTAAKASKALGALRAKHGLS